jgi:hypothetical protein
MWWHGQYDDVNAMRNRFLKVLGQHRVAALITGDEHNYSRLVLDERMGEYTEVVKHPVTQLISGGAGAPWYAQDFKTPWAKQVAHFDLRQHLIVLEARGDALIGRAVTAGGETIETFTLDSGL